MDAMDARRILNNPHKNSSLLLTDALAALGRIAAPVLEDFMLIQSVIRAQRVVDAALAKFDLLAGKVQMTAELGTVVLNYYCGHSDVLRLSAIEALAKIEKPSATQMDAALNATHCDYQLRNHAVALSVNLAQKFLPGAEKGEARYVIWKLRDTLDSQYKHAELFMPLFEILALACQRPELVEDIHQALNVIAEDGAPVLKTKAREMLESLEAGNA
jgi:hypothetical protein